MADEGTLQVKTPWGSLSGGTVGVVILALIIIIGAGGFLTVRNLDAEIELNGSQIADNTKAINEHDRHTVEQTNALNSFAKEIKMGFQNMTSAQWTAMRVAAQQCVNQAKTEEARDKCWDAMTPKEGDTGGKDGQFAGQ